jgi:peptidoglycan-associated lipoprotein
MKASRLTYLMVIALAFTFAATGCKRKPKGVTELPNRPGRVGPGSSIPIGNTFDPNANGVNGINSTELPGNIDPDVMKNDRETLQAHTVQFAYDSVAIRSTEQSKVDAVASYMKSAPGHVALLIEGHCDERGTEEYNRALGERRALALRETLMSAGVSGGRVVTRSYGKDRKVDTGSSEASHARNRRGVFVLLTPN